MIDLERRRYPYAVEVNEGILRHFRGVRPGTALDVGCGRGELAHAIKELGWEVWGVESDPEALETARNRMDRVIDADLQDVGRVASELEGKQFDALVMSDVLEHLYDPYAVLRRYIRFVKPGGRVLISLPNAVTFTNRLKWLLGRVEYEDTGVMDRTHIRFFTFRSAREVVEASGCRVERVDSTPNLVRSLLPMVKRFTPLGYNPRGIIDSPSYRFYMRWIYPVERKLCSLWKGMFAFRIILVARRAEPPDPARLPLSVVMITMNEEKAVEKVVKDIFAVAPEAEVLLVDSSKDRTPEIAEALGARVIRQFPPKGYGPAMDLALRSANGRVVVTLDCDDTYPPEMIPVLAQLIDDGAYDLADGVRTWRKPAAMPWLNFFANFGFAMIASVVFGRLILDLHSGMRAYRKSLIDEMEYNPKGAALPVELLLRPMRLGRRVRTVNIDYRPRVGDSTMRPLESALWTVKRIWRARFA